MNFIQLLYYGANYGQSAFKQLQFMKSFLQPIIHKHCIAANYTLSEKEKKKVNFYYPLFNHIVNCENYLSIKGRKLTIEESKRLAIISAQATLYDDLIDEESWTKEQYYQILYGTLPLDQQTPKVKLFFGLLQELNEHWTPTNNYQNTLKVAIDWQIESANQLNKNISLSEILHISKQKCGNSSLTWAIAMDENWNEKDKAFIFQSGYVGQMVNDFFDAYKDREDGIYTLVRKSNSIQEIAQLFKEECTKLHQLILQTNATKTLQTKTIRQMACIHAFGLVSLHHLQKTEKKYGIPINWELPLRNELVTDMAFWSNKFKLLQYACALAKWR